ncbi:hypothetical protein DTO164E3_455 [Paecilomyces variotii]|nr:hypothetical protein DTO032I3_1821 [Paecilomyces variotii]KAJ9207181.1 hypothetical protein DTO164E3_455 [Paecilomyces variotii]KAJ9281017.1 hypothetical protein DTO021D3_2071 [Paecilomyces variotii]KAJ9345390.1 hypothetical protein DTO027B6_1921 [Paecilomyces variotii]KAJ9386122.1 hypothetical protein DTO032I4_3853 [Paecilomyces variotii]
MASASTSTSTSEQSDNLQSKIPIIILNSDDSSSDDDDDVQIISVRSIQNKGKHHHGEKNAPGPSDANVYQESITSSQPPKRSRSLERAETNSSPPPKKQRRSTEPEPQNDPDMPPCNTSGITMGHFDERYGSRITAETPIRSDPEDKNNNIHPSPSPYTKEFFIDLADTISIIFPIGSFASQHNCSPAEVSRAISAVVTSPLLDPELHESCSWGDGSSSAMSIEEYGRMMVDVWKHRYRKMVIADEDVSGGLDGDGGSSGRGERDVADVEKDEPTTTRRWMERDVFGIYVECEPSVGEQSSVIEV